MAFTSTTVTATAISAAAVSAAAAGAVFFLLPRQAVVTVLAATVAGGEVIASRGVSAQFVYAMMSPYERVRIRHLT